MPVNLLQKQEAGRLGAVTHGKFGQSRHRARSGPAFKGVLQPKG